MFIIILFITHWVRCVCVCVCVCVHTIGSHVRLVSYDDTVLVCLLVWPAFSNPNGQAGVVVGVLEVGVGVGAGGEEWEFSRPNC